VPADGDIVGKPIGPLVGTALLVGGLTGGSVGKLTGVLTGEPVVPTGGAVQTSVMPKPEEMKPLLQMHVSEKRAAKEFSGQTMQGEPAYEYMF
jgi:hypothetical protein